MPAPWSGVALARIVGEMHGQEVINTLHFATNEVINDGNREDLLLQLAVALIECAVETLLPAVTSDYRLVQVDAQLLTPVLSNPVVQTAVPENVGELSATSVSFAATVVTKRTNLGGKTHRGRMSLPPPGEAQVANSLIDGPTLVLVAAFLTCLAGKFLGATPTTFWRLGVLSAKTLKATNSYDQSFTVVSGLSPRAELGSMVSRKKGHGD